MSENKEKPKKPRRKRREFSPEFKAGAVKLVLQEDKSTAQVARDLDLTESALRIWVEQAKADRGEGKPGALTTAEREELSRLRKRVRELEMEREILKNAAVHSTSQRNTCCSLAAGVSNPRVFRGRWFSLRATASSSR